MPNFVKGFEFSAGLEAGAALEICIFLGGADDDSLGILVFSKGVEEEVPAFSPSDLAAGVPESFSIRRLRICNHSVSHVEHKHD